MNELCDVGNSITERIKEKNCANVRNLTLKKYRPCWQAWDTSDAKDKRIQARQFIYRQFLSSNTIVEKMFVVFSGVINIVI